MKTAKELYPKAVAEDGYWWGACDYQPILDQFGNILLQVDEKNYQGDSWVLYEKDGQYGYLCFGWGSCSGCDALQGCESWDAIDRLIESFEKAIQWCSKEEWIKFLHDHDWEGDYIYSIEEGREFVRLAKEMFPR